MHVVYLVLLQSFNIIIMCMNLGLNNKGITLQSREQKLYRILDTLILLFGNNQWRQNNNRYLGIINFQSQVGIYHFIKCFIVLIRSILYFNLLYILLSVSLFQLGVFYILIYSINFMVKHFIIIYFNIIFMFMDVQAIKTFLKKQGCKVRSPQEIQEIYLGYLENANQGLVLLQKYLKIQEYSKVKIQQITSKFVKDQSYLNLFEYLNTPPDESVKKEKQLTLIFTFKLQKKLSGYNLKFERTELDRIVQELKVSKQQSLIKLLKQNNIHMYKDKILEPIPFKDFLKKLNLIWLKKQIFISKKILHSDDVKLVQLDLEDNSQIIRKTYINLQQNDLIKHQKYYEQLVKFNHPNIAKHQKVYREQKSLVVVSKFVEGVTLKEFIKMNFHRTGKNYRISKIQIVKQIKSALQYLKKNGLQHGDLRPANILITNQNKPILTNFPPPNYYGLSQKSMRQRQLYKTPKQLVNKSDLWGLTIILLQLHQRIQIEKLINNKQTSMAWLIQEVEKIQNEQILWVAQQLLQTIKITIQVAYEVIQAHQYQNRYDNLKRIKKILKEVPSYIKNKVLKYYKSLPSLNHPNIIIYQDVLIDKDDIVVIKTQVKGVSLKQYMKINSQIIYSSMPKDNEIIYEQKILKFYNEISSALKYLKSKNIIHEVICPRNILMSDQGKPIIVQLAPPLFHIQKNEIELYKLSKNMLRKGQFNKDMWPIAIILFQLYFKKQINELINYPSLNIVQDLQTITEKIKNQQIRQIIKEIVFPGYKRKIQQQKAEIQSQVQVKINADLKIQQKVVHFDKMIKFSPILTTNNQEIKIQQKENFTQTFIDLLYTKSNELKNHIIYETYQRCKMEMMNPIQSKEVQKQFIKDTINNKFHPLLTLGSLLRQDNKIVHYSKQSTPFSAISLMMLVLQIGSNEQKIKSLIDFAISKQQFTYLINIKPLKQQIMSILKKHYNNKNNPIITQVEWYSNQKIIVDYYYPQNSLGLKKRIEGPNKVKQISNETFRDAFALSPQDLDSRGDFDFVNGGIAKMHIRGGLPYFQPNGWIRYGLNVNKFTERDGNDKWLRMDGNDGEWAIFYHGLGNNAGGDQVKKDAKSILQSQFRAGSGQVHKDQKLFIPRDLYNRLRKNPKAFYQYKKQTQVGEGVYGSPLINEVCLGYTKDTIIESKSYRVAFQCRINPQKVYISDRIKSYWVVREPQFIRPYGLLIGKVSDIDKQQQITDKFKKLFQQYQNTGVFIQTGLSVHNCIVM